MGYTVFECKHLARTKYIQESSRNVRMNYPPLYALFSTNLFLFGRPPEDWKYANITPVFKMGIKTLIANYRQVPLLSIACKLCERCVLKKLLPELIHVLTPLQHGFIPGRSCVTQLLSVLRNLGSSLDTGDEVDVVYLDFSKA